MELSTLFVYGSLMSGFWNHDRYCRDALTIEPSVTTGLLYHLPQGFPAMFDAPDGQVHGEVMTFPDIGKTLRELDYLEGYRPGGNSHYIRIQKDVTILTDNRVVTAWVYVYPLERLCEMNILGIIVQSGCWKRTS
jgi:gamma-glutamylcyclotransferase (GGCT)/AIG2-like uncharacterized protein YtfP